MCCRINKDTLQKRFSRKTHKLTKLGKTIFQLMMAQVEQLYTKYKSTCDRWKTINNADC